MEKVWGYVRQVECGVRLPLDSKTERRLLRDVSRPNTLSNMTYTPHLFIPAPWAPYMR